MMQKLIACLALGMVTSCAGFPIRGNTPWSVILCKLKNDNSEPQTLQFWRNQLTTTGTTLRSYWRDISFGTVTTTATVRGWYQLDVTQSEAQNRDNARWQISEDCIKAARDAGYRIPQGHRIITVTNKGVNSGAVGGRVVSASDLSMSFTVHEMGHGYGLGHSFTEDVQYQNAVWSRPGEYGDLHDVMSCMNCYTFSTSNFGSGGPGLIAEFANQKGWIARNRIVRFGAGGETSRSYYLYAMNMAYSSSGTRLIRIPFDAHNPFRYITVEFVRKISWSRGIPRDTVLIHEVHTNGTASVQSVSNRRGNEEYLPGETWYGRGISVKVERFTGNYAYVTVTSRFAERCLPGYVWREATGLSDKICVPIATRTSTREENRLAASRRQPGSIYCRQGYVWREATGINDKVCVPVWSRTRARNDNTAHRDRSNPAKKVYGPLTCKKGLVWREIDQYDYVCVSVSSRTAARTDNRNAASRRVSSSSIYCKQGYVWREAFPGDYVCVTVTRRTATRNENNNARSNLAKPYGSTNFDLNSGITIMERVGRRVTTVIRAASIQSIDVQSFTYKTDNTKAWTNATYTVTEKGEGWAHIEFDLDETTHHNASLNLHALLKGNVNTFADDHNLNVDEQEEPHEAEQRMAKTMSSTSVITFDVYGSSMDNM